jgi:F1F0 ATPase subunit 2
MTNLLIEKAALFFTFGALLGAAYFYALDWNVRLYAAAGAGWKAMLLHLARMLGAVAIFTVFARQGALPLLSGFVGFLVMRTVAIRRQRVAPGGSS